MITTRARSVISLSADAVGRFYRLRRRVSNPRVERGFIEAGLPRSRTELPIDHCALHQLATLPRARGRGQKWSLALSEKMPISQGTCGAVTTTAAFEIAYSQFLDPDGRAAGTLPAFARDPEALIPLYRSMVLT